MGNLSCDTTVVIAMGKAGTVQSSKQTCATWAKEVTENHSKLSFDALISNRNRITESFQLEKTSRII